MTGVPEKQCWEPAGRVPGAECVGGKEKDSGGPNESVSVGRGADSAEPSTGPDQRPSWAPPVPAQMGFLLTSLEMTRRRE